MVEKLCECGCGEPTNIIKTNRPKFNHVKGQPYRYVWGHNPSARKAPGETLRIKRRNRLAKMTRDDVFLVYRIYMRSDLTLRAIAESIWEKYGFANYGSCWRSLESAFRSYGLPTKSQLAGRPRCRGCHEPIIEGETNPDCCVCRERLRSRARRAA